MKNESTSLVKIQGRNGYKRDVFLTLTGKEGQIYYANAAMNKCFDLKMRGQGRSNLFELVHPLHFEKLRSAIHQSQQEKNPYSIEIYLRNSCLVYTKWKVSCLNDSFSKKEVFLFEGYQILEEKRMENFRNLHGVDFTSIMAGIEHGVLILGPEGEILFANHKAAENLNTSLDTIYSSNNITFLWNSGWNLITERGDPISYDQNPLLLALETGKVHTAILQRIFSSGCEKRLSCTSQPLFKAGETKPFSVVSSFSEINPHTDSRIDADPEQIFSFALRRNTNDILWLVNEEAVLLFANLSFYKFLGIPATGKNPALITELVPMPVFKALYKDHMQVLNTCNPIEKEQTVKWADGTEFGFRIQIFPAGEFEGRKVLAGQAVRLEDKTALERQLMETNEQLLILNRAASNAIWEWDIRKDQTFRNESLLDLIGYPLEETSGLGWWLERIHPGDRDRVQSTVYQAIAQKLVSWEESYRFQCGSGSYKHICDRGFIIYEEEEPVKMVGSLQDITNLKDLEERLTEERIQKQKEISETVIQVQERERSRIGYELHDNINQILTTVMLFVNMLAPDKEAEKKIKNKIHEYVCLSIEEIRKLSRELAVPKLKEAGLIDSIKTLIDDIHLSHSLKIKFSFDPENMLLSQPKKLTLFRITQEQLKNILRHSKATEAQISLHNLPNAVQLRITDNGVGFNSNQTFRGIGLSNILERTRFYNGKFDLQTAPGQGCSLTISIPD